MSDKTVVMTLEIIHGRNRLHAATQTRGGSKPISYSACIIQCEGGGKRVVLKQPRGKRRGGKKSKIFTTQETTGKMARMLGENNGLLFRKRVSVYRQIITCEVHTTSK